MRIFRKQPQAGDHVEATISKGIRPAPHTIRGVMQTDDTLIYISDVTGEATEMGLRNLEAAGYKVRVVPPNTAPR